MEERQALREFVHLPVAVNVLQGIANGDYQEREILRLETQLKSEVAGTPFYIISRALIIAVSEDLIKTDNLRVEPTRPLNDKDTEFIDALYQGWNNSQIIKKFDWDLEDVYRQRGRVFRALEVSGYYHVVVWEARRREIESQLKNV